MRLSIIICTYNPSSTYLNRALEALKNQTLPRSDWELILVDNASEKPVSETFDISWHPKGRIVTEQCLGLTHARFRGLKESRGEILVYIDDDNVVCSDYLEKALALFYDNPKVGCVSGNITAEYQVTPPCWFRGEYESWIAVRRIEKDRFSSFWHPLSEPCGAGMVVRRAIVERFAFLHSRDSIVLGRSGSSLLSGEDVEISNQAMEMGYLVGQVTSLRMTHLIPSARLSEEYLFRLYRNLSISGWLVSAKKNDRPVIRLMLRDLCLEAYRMVCKGRIGRRLAIERLRGFFQARKILRRRDVKVS
jgi:glycosyltransferase involved in cell wall biosynthesis